MSFEEIGAREGEFLCSLSIMEDVFLKLEVKEKRQAKIQNTFENNLSTVNTIVYKHGTVRRMAKIEFFFFFFFFFFIR